VFLYLSNILFSGFIQFKGNFVCAEMLVFPAGLWFGRSRRVITLLQEINFQVHRPIFISRVNKGILLFFFPQLWPTCLHS